MSQARQEIDRLGFRQESNRILSDHYCFGFGPKVRECIIPTSEWDGDTGIDQLIEEYRKENPPMNKLNAYRK